MQRMILVLTLSLWTTPLAGQHSPRRHSGFAGHVTHLLTVNRDHVGPPARPIFVRANGDPCPPEPEPCPRNPRPSLAKYMILSVGGGALLGGAITAVVCQELGHEWRRRGKTEEEKRPCSEMYAYTLFTGAAVGAFVGAGVGHFLYEVFEGQVDYPAAAPVDLVTFRIPIG